MISTRGPSDHPRSIAVGVTGASGMPIARRLLACLAHAGVDIHLCRSRAARQVIADEMDGEPGEDRLLAGLPASAHIEEWGERDYRAPFASGSSRTSAMVIVPCSMATLAAIAHGHADNLIRRGADAMLKERRPLVLVPRESPLSTIHLDNMARAAQAGAVIIPPVLTFYQRPGEDVAAQIDFTVSRVLDHLGIENDLYARWGDAGIADGVARRVDPPPP